MNLTSLKTTPVVAAGLFAITCFPGTLCSQEKMELKTLKQKASYLVGFDIGEDVLRRELAVDYEILVKGFLDAVNKRQPPMSKSEMESVMVAFEKQVNAIADQKWKNLARKNMEIGTSFLTINKLAYKTITKSTGEKPKLGSSIKIHVIGKHCDQTEFENTYKAKQPIVVTVGTTIRGLDEAVQRMQAGEKWEIYIPSNLAFGQRGSPPAVGPNETLIYEVELLEVIKK
jgi:FKBP-type peptidyl-prolyl cis-trans isomerase FklB